ncbi:hypothetical protein STCU_02796 [Strigomonas culicis]|nr:hypothetical protein STCU_02796 [Strigomonas culicis]|eukprot:EPY32642.1 hypothetical protein STCU_02796 [Strigomonas culicis]
MREYARNMNNIGIDKNSQEYARFFEYTRDYAFHMILARRACALLRRLGVEKIATIGMCWGARVAFDLAGEGLVEAASSAHPSRFTAEVMAPAARVPICVLPSKDENAEDMAGVEKAVNAHTVEPHVYKLYDKLTHGFFGNRFDYEKCTAEEKEQLDDAIRVSVDFFNKALV